MRCAESLSRQQRYCSLPLQDVEAVKSVQGQLKAFQAEMERDGNAQRSEARKVIAQAIRRAQKLVDSTLQASLRAVCSLVINQR